MRELPLNRIVAFLGPVIAVIAGAVADWLFVHVHFLGTWHTQGEVGTWIGDVIVFGVTSVLVWLGQQKWLSGWISWEQERALLHQANSIPPPGEPPPGEPPPPPPPSPRPLVNPATKLPNQPGG